MKNLINDSWEIVKNDFIDHCDHSKGNVGDAIGLTMPNNQEAKNIQNKMKTILIHSKSHSEEIQSICAMSNSLAEFTLFFHAFYKLKAMLKQSVPHSIIEAIEALTK